MWCNLCGAKETVVVKPPKIKRWNKKNPGRVRRLRFCVACWNCFATEEKPSMAEDPVDINCMAVTNTYTYETCVMRLRKKFVNGDDCPESVIPTEEVAVDCAAFAEFVKNSREEIEW